jgi:hypothetical protein
MGGGGFMGSPQISPWTSRPGVVFLGCDMGAIYRSEDLGASGWTMLDEREVRSSSQYSGGYYDNFGNGTSATRLFSVALDPSKDGHVFGALGTTMRESTSYGDSWSSFLNQPAPAISEVTCATFSRDGNYLLVASPQGLFRYATGAGTWSAAKTMSDDAVPVTMVDILWFATPKAFNGGLWFAASHQYVFLSTDQGATWKRFDSGLPAGSANRIAGFAGGGSTNVVLLVSIATTSPTPSFDGGVRRCVVSSVSPGAPTWTNASTGLGTSTGSGNTMPQYRWLAVDDDNPDIRSFVATLDTTTTDYGPPFYAIYRWNGTSWTPVYDGFAGHQASATITVKAESGWIDEREHGGTPPGLGWGFGGAPSAIAVDPKDSSKVIFTNTGFVDVSEDGASGASNPSWRQRYSRAAPGALGDQWQSTGLDVTSVWNYRIHKNKSFIHFLCSTDIGLARSGSCRPSGGKAWPITIRREHSTRSSAPQRAAGLPIHPSCGA